MTTETLSYVTRPGFEQGFIIGNNWKRHLVEIVNTRLTDVRNVTVENYTKKVGELNDYIHHIMENIVWELADGTLTAAEAKLYTNLLNDLRVLHRFYPYRQPMYVQIPVHSWVVAYQGELATVLDTPINQGVLKDDKPFMVLTVVSTHDRVEIEVYNNYIMEKIAELLKDDTTGRYVAAPLGDYSQFDDDNT